jgi:hypothetical protein
MSLVLIGKKCLALPTGMQRGGGFLGDFCFPFFPVLGDSDTLPDHNVFLLFHLVFLTSCLLVIFQSIPLLVSFLSPFIFLSLSNATPRNEYDERDEKDDANKPFLELANKNTNNTTSLLLDEQKRTITDHSIRYIDKYLSITPCTCTYLLFFQPERSHDASHTRRSTSVHVHMLHAPERFDVVH